MLSGGLEQISHNEKQLAAASEATEALVNVNAAVEEIRFRQGIDIISREEDFKAFKAAVYAPKEELRQVLLRNSPFLPSSVFSELSEYLANIELALGEMITGETEHTIGRHMQIERPWDDATATFAMAVIAIRDFLGVGPFSPSFRKPRGSADPLQHSETKKKAREIVRLLERQYDRPTSPLLPID